MSSMVNVFAGDGCGGAEITNERNSTAIWIRAGSDTVSLSFDRAHRDALRAALDEADRRELSTLTPEQLEQGDETEKRA